VFTLTCGFADLRIKEERRKKKEEGIKKKEGCKTKQFSTETTIKS